MDGIRFEDLTRDELRTVGRLSGRVPGDRECAGLRIQRLECDLVALAEEIEKEKALMTNPCLPPETRTGASLTKLAHEYRSFLIKKEIKALTERYFDNGHGAPSPYTEG